MSKPNTHSQYAIRLRSCLEGEKHERLYIAVGSKRTAAALCCCCASRPRAQSFARACCLRALAAPARPFYCQLWVDWEGGAYRQRGRVRERKGRRLAGWLAGDLSIRVWPLNKGTSCSDGLHFAAGSWSSKRKASLSAHDHRCILVEVLPPPVGSHSIRHLLASWRACGPRVRLARRSHTRVAPYCTVHLAPPPLVNARLLGRTRRSTTIRRGSRRRATISGPVFRMKRQDGELERTYY